MKGFVGFGIDTRTYMAPDTGGGEQEVPPPATGAPPAAEASAPAVAPPANTTPSADGGTPSPTPPAATPPPTRTLTQEEFDRALAARLEGERKKYNDKLADYEELKAKAQRLKELDDTQKSETEKLREQLAEAEQKSQAAEQAREAAARQARETAIRAAVVAEAAKQGFADPLDAYRLLDMGALSLASDETVAGLADMVQSLATSKPYLKGKQAPVVPPANPSRQSGSPARTDADRYAEYFGGASNDFWQGKS
jgi:hypothetical protein